MIRRLGGRTPWSARDALVPQPGEQCEQAGEGAGRGTGGPPSILLVRLLALLFLAALAAPAATFYVTISGLGGEADYDQRFKMWAQDIDSSLKKAGTPDPNVFTLIAPTREQIRTRFASLASSVKATDNLVVVLIGHGTFDGVDYKFNLPGPDITGAELSTLLDRVPSARQLVVVTTSSSGGSIEFLRKPNRIVVAATKAGSEKNATIFARYWAEALREPSADTDKNESVSALEAFRYAQRKTKEFFDTQKRLATEHSVFEDTGKGTGVAAAENPPLRVRAGRPPPLPTPLPTATPPRAGWPLPSPSCASAPMPPPARTPPRKPSSKRRKDSNRPSTS